MSSTSSSSPEPERIPKKFAKNTKDKGKNRSTGAEEQGKNEGANLNWAYKPPSGTVLLDSVADTGGFDWEDVNADENLELWLIRVPDSVKPKYLENTALELPSSSKSTRVGVINRKHTSYDIWTVGDDDDQQLIGGEEIKGLSCLLPRKSKRGKLYQAPRPIARHLVISAQSVLPTPERGATAKQNPPRQSYPKEVLKHRFLPYGTLPSGDTDDSAPMDVDAAPAPADNKAAVASPVKVEGTKVKGKKRKGEGESPKKTKKAKIAS